LGGKQDDLPVPACGVAPKSGDFGATTAAATEQGWAAECKRFVRTPVVGKPGGVPGGQSK